MKLLPKKRWSKLFVLSPLNPIICFFNKLIKANTWNEVLQKKKSYCRFWEDVNFFWTTGSYIFSQSQHRCKCFSWTKIVDWKKKIEVSKKKVATSENCSKKSLAAKLLPASTSFNSQSIFLCTFLEFRNFVKDFTETWESGFPFHLFSPLVLT